jgi:GTP pyrophosphokinase
MIQGNKIRQRRELMGMTQQELADKLFVSVQAVSQWENDRTQPDSDRILQLANILGTTANELLNESSTGMISWQLMDQMFSEEHMYSRLKAIAQEENLEETYRALPYMRECHRGQTRKPVIGSVRSVPYIVHPLMMACHGV